jgi:hypothetical protein
MRTHTQTSKSDAGHAKPGRTEPRHADNVKRSGKTGPAGGDPSTVVEAVIRDWPKEPQDSARRLMKEYGAPDEFSPSRLIWNRTKDGWKRTELSCEEVPHDFPAHHTDFLEQFIDYKVPVERFTDLARFDGSVIAERTKGELSARCGGTSMNFVAINLAHDIVRGVLTVGEAREAYTRLFLACKRGGHPPYAQGFQFELPKGDTKDVDAPAV